MNVFPACGLVEPSKATFDSYSKIVACICLMLNANIPSFTLIGINLPIFQAALHFTYTEQNIKTNMPLITICLTLLFFLVSLSPSLQAQVTKTSNPSTPKPKPEAFQSLPIGDINPEGWLQMQLRQNLEGFTGHLDSLVPDLILKDDIYGKNRITRKLKAKDVGAIGEEGAWQAQFLWWNSETQSNWRDGYLRTAILLKDKKHLQLSKAYVERILATQDPDGYLGIYDKDLRYSFKDENGELWSKTTLLR